MPKTNHNNHQAAPVVGHLVEAFPSIQGEGYLVGAMQLFIRLAGCNLHCRSCDTPRSWSLPESFSLWPWPGRKTVRKENPILPDVLMAALEENYPLNELHSISLTGGEPLAQGEFLLELVRRLHERKLRVLLETNGTLATGLEALVPLVEFWSVDLKISRSWGLPGKMAKRHEEFLSRIPPERTALKVVLDANDDPDSILAALPGLDLRSFAAVLQPITTGQSNISDWDSHAILEWLRLLQPRFKEVRWIPQVQKLLRIP